MSLFDKNLVNSYASKTKSEWKRIVFDEILKFHQDQTLNGLWSTIGYTREEMVKLWVPARFQSKTAYIQWLRGCNGIPRIEQAIYDEVFSNIFNKYGVSFTYKLTRNKQGYISGIQFIGC